MPFATQLQWLVTMSKAPGFKAHAWHRAQQLEADDSKMFAGIKDALILAMGGTVSSSASAPLIRERSPLVGPKSTPHLKH